MVTPDTHLPDDLSSLPTEVFQLRVSLVSSYPWLSSWDVRNHHSYEALEPSCKARGARWITVDPLTRSAGAQDIYRISLMLAQPTRAILVLALGSIDISLDNQH